MKILYLAGGASTRWNNFMGCAKQELKICGERIIDRLHRQFSAGFPSAKHYLITREVAMQEPDIHCYHLPASTVNWNTAKFLSSKALWQDAKEDVLFLYGDVFIMEKDARLIVRLVNLSKGRDIVWFGNKSEGEMLAVYVPAPWIERFRRIVTKLLEAEYRGETMGGGWRACRLACGLPAESDDILNIPDDSPKIWCAGS
jgi:hypothetical protein